jgi:hypothetical protein
MMKVATTAVLLFVSASASITSEQCNNITMPMLTTTYHDGACVIECDGKKDGQPNLECLAFSDGVLSAFGKQGMYDPKTMCMDTTVQAMGADPQTDDPEMVVASCPEFFLYAGWDRNMKRTLGNMRQEVVCKTSRALQVMIDMLKHG